MENVKKVMVVLMVLGLTPLAYGDAFSDSFENFGPLADSVGVPFLPNAPWQAAPVNSSNDSNQQAIGGWGFSWDAAPPQLPVAIVTDDLTYDHVAVNVGRMKPGDQVSVMFDLWNSSWFAELWVGGADMVDGANHVEQALMVQASGSGASPGHIGYNLYREEGGAENINAGGTLTVANDNAGRVGHWTEFRLTMLDQGGNSTWGLDSALVETRNAFLTKSGAHTGAWFTVGTFDTHVNGIGGMTPNADSDIYIGLGGMGANMDNLVVTPEPMTMALLGLGSLAVLRRKRA